MSESVELMNDCIAIRACLPHLTVTEVLAALQKHSSVQQYQRIRLSLQDIFQDQDNNDSVTNQQNDIELVHKLFPDIAKCKVSSLLSYLGNEENRKAVMLRLLLQNCVIDTKASKHKLDDEVFVQHDEVKKARTSNYFSSTFTEASDSCNSEEDNVKNGGFVDDIDLSESIASSIFQPSTSRAVWNPYTLNYEDRANENIVKSSEITKDIPTTSIKHVEGEIQEIKHGNRNKIVLNNFQDKGEEVIDVEEIEDKGSTIKINDDDDDDVDKIAKEEFSEKPFVDISDSETHKSQREPSMENMISTRGSNKDNPKVNQKLMGSLMEMFPEACPNYLRNLCSNIEFSEKNLNELITKILSEDYPQRERPVTPEERLDPDEQFEILKQVLPDADPTYLRFYCEQMADEPEKLKQFISDAIETRNYPTMKEYVRKQQLSAQQRKYTTDFKVETFLEIIPDPVKHFENPQRMGQFSRNDMFFVCTFFRNKFPALPIKLIRSSVFASEYKLMKIYEELKEKMNNKSVKKLRMKRKPIPLPDNCQNIPLLQEVAYISHKQEILEYIKIQKKREILERQEAIKKGLCRTCNCCFDNEILERDIVRCENGCEFCKECVNKSVEVAFGSGKLEFTCLTNCQSHFSLQTLQCAISPKLFSKVAQKKQLEEVKAAGIEDLEMCPFCDFATIPAENDKLFRCLNPECMKESCRQCKEPSHIPLRCDEIEKDEDVKRRTYIENKMSEALLKKCYRCEKSFIKADGCNKITCTCGAMQCYLCGKAVTGYDHFNGQGGDKYHLCPLYSNTEELHEQAVLQGAKAAQAEIGIDTKQLKIDPTADIEGYYSKLKKGARPLTPMVFNNVPVAALNHDHHHHYHHRRRHRCRCYRRIDNEPVQPPQQRLDNAPQPPGHRHL